VNVLGSLLVGVVLGGAGAIRWSETATTAVAVGFLGAFTTFSTFTFETTALVRDDRAGAALIYAASSLVLGPAAAPATPSLARSPHSSRHGAVERWRLHSQVRLRLHRELRRQLPAPQGGELPRQLPASPVGRAARAAGRA